MKWKIMVWATYGSTRYDKREWMTHCTCWTAQEFEEALKKLVASGWYPGVNVRVETILE